jgi:outer membrane protein assembly factor BamA
MIISVESQLQENPRLLFYDDSLVIHSSELPVDDSARAFILRRITDSLVNSGYLAPLINESVSDSAIIVSIEKGKKFKWARLRFNFDEKIIGSKLADQISSTEGNTISMLDYKMLNEEILSHMNNTGHPFATIWLDSIDFVAEDLIAATMNILPNRKFYFDTIKVVSAIDISRRYLENHLDIRKGDVFDMRKVANIASTIDNIPFAELKGQPGLIFFGSEVSVSLDLIPKQVNRFDFLLGFRQDDSGLRKYRLTGEVLAELINKLGQGERVFFNYKSLAQGRQELKFHANYPFLFDLPFGLDFRFDLYLNESEFRDVGLDIGAFYLLHKNDILKIYWNNKTSRLVSIDTASIKQSRKLPDKLDISSNNLGIGLEYNKLNYVFNPSGGHRISIDAMIGQRKIIRNQEILGLRYENTDFSSAYDSLKTTSYGINSNLSLEYYIRLNNNFVIKLANSSGIRYAQTKLYQNELFRIGGLRMLRGFNEESITAQFYNVSTAELRLLISRNSNMFVFTDYGVIRDPYSTQKIWDRPVGFGVGINFDTGAGLLQLIFSLGSRYNETIDYRNANVHIGYSSIFR